MSVPYYPGSLFTPNLGLALFGMDEVLAENFVLLDAASGGSSVEINGAAVADPNFNDTTPSALSGKTNVKWQVDGSGNVSAYVPTAVPGGSDTQVQFNDGNAFGGAATLTWNKATGVLGSTTQFAFNRSPLTIPPWDVFTFSDAGPGAVWNSIALLSSGVTTNNLRKSLSVYYQGDLHQGGGSEYYGVQSNSFAILDGGSIAGRIAALGGQFGWKGTAAAPAGLQANGVMVQGRATGAGMTGGNLVSFISFNPQITAGATVDTAVGMYIDHAALNSTNVTNHNIGISVYVGAGGWGLDLVGGAGCAFGTAPLYHTTDAIINGGTVTDGWFSHTGTPEGAVTANIGSFCARLDGGAGTAFYVKESGTGNTGWVPVLTSAPSAPVTSVFGRVGVVVAASNDYSFAQLSGKAGLAQGGTNVDLSATGAATFVLAQDASHVISARALIAADIPNLAASIIASGALALARGGTAVDLSATGGAHSFLAQDASHVVSARQPAFTDISGAVTGAQLPNPSSSSLGGVQSAAAVSHQWINSISTSGVPALSQPAFSDISGTAVLTSQVTGILPTANGGTGAASPFESAGTLMFWNWFGFTHPGAASGGVGVGTGVSKLFYSMNVPVTIKITKVTLRIDSAISANVFVGIYNAAGTTKLLDSGAIANGGAAGVKQVTGLNVTLTPGIYIVFITGDNASLTVDGWTNVPNVEQNMNFSTPRLGTAANGVSGGVLPSTLGTLTANSAISVPNVLFEN